MGKRSIDPVKERKAREIWDRLFYSPIRIYEQNMKTLEQYMKEPLLEGYGQPTITGIAANLMAKHRDAAYKRLDARHKHRKA
jgi:uncharacterized protein with gpF-like domain